MFWSYRIFKFGMWTTGYWGCIPNSVEISNIAQFIYVGIALISNKQWETNFQLPGCRWYGWYGPTDPLPQIWFIFPESSRGPVPRLFFSTPSLSFGLGASCKRKHCASSFHHWEPWGIKLRWFRWPIGNCDSKKASNSLNSTISTLSNMLEPPFTGSHIDILKTGYSNNQNWMSFYGFGPAINVVCPPTPQQSRAHTKHHWPMPQLQHSTISTLPSTMAQQ